MLMTFVIILTLEYVSISKEKGGKKRIIKWRVILSKNMKMYLARESVNYFQNNSFLKHEKQDWLHV